jgi:hypothetical protein
VGRGGHLVSYGFGDGETTFREKFMGAVTR